MTTFLSYRLWICMNRISDSPYFLFIYFRHVCYSRATCIIIVLHVYSYSIKRVDCQYSCHSYNYTYCTLTTDILDVRAVWNPFHTCPEYIFEHFYRCISFQILNTSFQNNMFSSTQQFEIPVSIS